MAHIRSLLLQALNQAGLTATALTSSNGPEQVQITAQLTGDSLEIAPWLEQVVARLGGEPAISDIGWQHGTGI